jgi:low affinity Fe/Cu permease
MRPTRSRSWFGRFAKWTARATGKPAAFGFAAGLIVAWGLSGAIFSFSDTWQLVINTGTTIITFLMVFLIQNTQNRDAAAMQAKLDELLRAVGKARDQFIGVEHLTEREIEMIRRALEREVRSPDKKTGSAKGTVDRLLNRF